MFSLACSVLGIGLFVTANALCVSLLFAGKYSVFEVLMHYCVREESSHYRVIVIVE